MPNTTTKYRMYFLTMYNLSPIQKGIQAGHAALEYTLKYGDTQEYKDFIANDKTWIVLNGGTSGDMVKHCEVLDNLGINFERFYEPDLNNSISAICYLLSEEDWLAGEAILINDSGLPMYHSHLGLFTSQFKLAH